MKQGLPIESIEPGSIANRASIAPGDRLLFINGHRVRDVIDYWFLSGDYDLLLEIENVQGEIREIELVRGEGESLGILFDAPKPRRCSNSCIFCFVDQMPGGFRRSLYLKDEDYRLSFLFGNFVTLSSISRRDVNRIKRLRLSPLYVSVHATDDAVRRMMLGNRKSLPIFEILQELSSAGITIHAQVVLCPGINDGHHLDRTVNELATLFPGVSSLAIVPVGLTRHRDHLPNLQPVTRDYAAEFVSVWRAKAEVISEKLGQYFLFLADEFYIKAGIPFPHLSEYGDLPQLENGVGMIPLFMVEADKVTKQAEYLGSMTISIVTGESPHSYVREYLRVLSVKTGLTFQLIPIRSSLFGETVTVTGLVSGNDVLGQLNGMVKGSVLLIPDVMLKEGQGVFIDDMTLDCLQRGLGREVIVFKSSPEGLYEALRRIKAD
jgi:putative radical SAM enzyme (TIGR03279 family)